MKTYGGVEIQMHVFLTLKLVGGEWSASRPCRFNPGEKPPGTQWTGGLVGLRAHMGDLETRTGGKGRPERKADLTAICEVIS
jgi:hypothetical protein